MKKKIAILTTVGVLTVGLIGGTLAYFNAQTETASNVFTAGKGFEDGGNLLINLKENFDADADGVLNNDEKDITISKTQVTINENMGFLPGQDITKEPWVTNSAALDAYVAIKISVDDYTLDYTTGADEIFVKDGETTLAALTGLNMDDWTYVEKDGYVLAYYNEKLAAGTTSVPSTTSNAFATVKIDSELTDTTIKDFNVVLKAYAVQAQYNNSDVQAAIDAEFDY